MKKRNLIISSILAGSIFTIGVVGIAHACNGPGGHGGHQRGGEMMPMMRMFDLTMEQREAIRNIKTKQREQMRVTRDEMKNIQRALFEQTSTEYYDATKVRELADVKAKLMADMIVKRSETMNRIRKELTPEQAAKMDSMKQRRFAYGDD